MSTNGENGTGAILARVSGMVRDVIGEDWALDVPITMETSFGKDLELESIEFVALAEKLKAEYGRRVDFARWLSNMELGEIIQLRVGQLVEFIDQCLSQSATV
jgi:acyl carrier protein